MRAKYGVWLVTLIFGLGLAGEARAEQVDWSDYLEPKGASKPMPIRDTPQPVAKDTKAKKKAVAKKGKAAKGGAKARKKAKKPRRR